MKERFLKYINDNSLVNQGDMVLLAVSGGIDSMVMATLFNDAGFITGIAHCNFSLRDKESDMDEDLVKQFAEEINIPCFTVRFDTPEYAHNNGISIQMAARELRYNWFEKIRSENGFDSVAVAHNLNDNIETLIINLTRGTGISGLTGMKPKMNNIIRPLLFARRQEIAEYCTHRHIKFREDRSNAETNYTRNKIRHNVIPILKEINPSVELTLNETAARLTGVYEIVTAYINNLRNQLIKKRGELIIFDQVKLQEVSDNDAIIYELFKPFGITGSTVPDLINVIKGISGGQIITGSHRIVKNRREIIVTSDGTGITVKYIVPDINELRSLPFIVSAEITDLADEFQIPRDRSVACLDYGLVRFPLIIRKWQQGDFFVPFGMKQKKKLSDYFVDRKLSLPEKEKMLIIESAGTIAWIIGERIDDRFRISEYTSKILQIEAKSEISGL